MAMTGLVGSARSNRPNLKRKCHKGISHFQFHSFIYFLEQNSHWSDFLWFKKRFIYEANQAFTQTVQGPPLFTFVKIHYQIEFNAL